MKRRNSLGVIRHYDSEEDDNVPVLNDQVSEDRGEDLDYAAASETSDKLASDGITALIAKEMSSAAGAGAAELALLRGEAAEAIAELRSIAAFRARLKKGAKSPLDLGALSTTQRTFYNSATNPVLAISDALDTTYGSGGEVEVPRPIGFPAENVKRPMSSASSKPAKGFYLRKAAASCVLKDAESLTPIADVAAATSVGAHARVMPALGNGSSNAAGFFLLGGAKASSLYEFEHAAVTASAAASRRVFARSYADGNNQSFGRRGNSGRVKTLLRQNFKSFRTDELARAIVVPQIALTDHAKLMEAVNIANAEASNYITNGDTSRSIHFTVGETNSIPNSIDRPSSAVIAVGFSVPGDSGRSGSLSNGLRTKRLLKQPNGLQIHRPSMLLTPPLPRPNFALVCPSEGNVAELKTCGLAGAGGRNTPGCSSVCAATSARFWSGPVAGGGEGRQAAMQQQRSKIKSSAWNHAVRLQLLLQDNNS